MGNPYIAKVLLMDYHDKSLFILNTVTSDRLEISHLRFENTQGFRGKGGGSDATLPHPCLPLDLPKGKSFRTAGEKPLLSIGLICLFCKV